MSLRSNGGDVTASKAGGAILARCITLPVSIACGLLTVSVIVDDLGAAGYAVVSLLVTLQALLVFLDWGTGAAVLDGAARYRVSRQPADVMVPLRAGLLATSVTSGALFFAVVAIAWLVGWESLLGVAHARLDLAMVLLFGVGSLARPLLVLTTVLIGVARGVAAVLVLGVVPVVALLISLAASTWGAGLPAYAAAITLGQLVAGLAALALVSREIPGLFRRSGHDAGPAPGTTPSIRSLAAPMLLINITAPLVMGLDRLILSHLSTVAALASYSLAAQLIQPLLSFLPTVQQLLWSNFAAARGAGRDPKDHYRHWLVRLVLAAACVAGGVTIAFPFLASWVTDARVSVPWSLALAIGLVACAYTIAVAPGALLTSPAGLRFQAGALAITVLANLAISVALAPRLGALGVVVGSLVGTGLFTSLLLGRSRSELMSLSIPRRLAAGE